MGYVAIICIAVVCTGVVSIVMRCDVVLKHPVVKSAQEWSALQRPGGQHCDVVFKHPAVKATMHCNATITKWFGCAQM